MEYAKALEYYNAINVIEAQGYLVDMNVSLFPNMKDKKAYFNNMKKIAHPRELQKETSFEDFIRQVKNG